MFRRAGASLAASAALTAAALFAVAPMASAEPVPPGGGPQPMLLDDLDVLPVQACGLDVGIPILSELLGADAAPGGTSCSMVDQPAGG